MKLEYLRSLGKWLVPCSTLESLTPTSMIYLYRRQSIAAISRMKLPNPQFPALSESKSVCGRRIIFDPTTPFSLAKRLEPLATLSLFPYKMF